VPEGRTLSLTLRHTFLRLPGPGFETRLADPRVGYFDAAYRDLDAILDQPLERSLATRWRLVKKQGTEPLSEPETPITLYLDPSIPPRFRGAVRRGALGWNEAFEAAGFRDAIQVRDLPEGASLVDTRYSGIQWFHRGDTGAKSTGQPRTDPRTGEILHAVVSLDSAHTRRVPGLATPFDASQSRGCALALEALPDPEGPEAALDAEVAYITAHEVGHALGLAHNMAASTYSGSVMDYLPPDLRLEGEEVVTAHAYPDRIGPYDVMAIRWGYSPGLAASALDAIVREGLDRGLVYPQPEDVRWSEWDLGPDPILWLDKTTALRKLLLSRLAKEGLRPGEPATQLFKRFELLYDMHLVAVDAVTRRVGGMFLARGVGGDGQPAPTWVPVAEQRRALRAVLAALSVDGLAIPDELARLLVVKSESSTDLASLTESGMTFTSVGSSRLLAAMILDGLLEDDERLARLAVGSQVGSLSLDEVLQSLVDAAWRPPPADPKAAAVSRAVQAVVVDELLLMARNSVAVPEARAAALDHLTRLRAKLATWPARDVEARAHLRFLQRRIEELLNPSGTAGRPLSSG
jgi:Met-zincin/Domain of unknown function (DUF5117)